MILWKIVVRDRNGKVIQIYERYESDRDLTRLLNEAVDQGYTVTISALS